MQDVRFLAFGLNSLFANYIVPNLTEHCNTTNIRCARLCVEEKSCQSYFHSSQDACFLSNTIVATNQDLVPANGMRYYRKSLKLSPLTGFKYSPDGKVWYKSYLMDRVNAEEAIERCNKSGGILMMANTEEKRQFMVKMGLQNGNVSQWVGGIKLSKKWTWLDGSLIVKTHWRKSGTDLWAWNRCIAYCWCDGEYSWDDVKCSGKKHLHGFMCEAGSDRNVVN